MLFCFKTKVERSQHIDWHIRGFLYHGGGHYMLINIYSLGPSILFSTKKKKIYVIKKKDMNGSLFVQENHSLAWKSKCTDWYMIQMHHPINSTNLEMQRQGWQKALSNFSQSTFSWTSWTWLLNDPININSTHITRYNTNVLFF